MSVVLVVGSTGAGKTTYSSKLERELPGVVYSIDNWMKELYWQDMPKNPNNSWFQENGAWYMERISRCESLITKNVLDRAKLQQKSILDLGFTTAEHRIRFIKKFQENGIEVSSHFLDIDEEVRWQRVQQRNTQQGETFVMNVDRQMFDYIETIFEPPSRSEGASVILVR